MKNVLRLLGGVVLAVLMTACGGGGGSAGTTSSGTGAIGGTGGTGGGATVPGTTTPTLVVSDFSATTNKTTINNGGSDTVVLTVVALDAARNVVPGAAVRVAVDQNAVFTPGSTQTDSAGVYTGVLGIGSDKTDRDITISVTVNDLVKKTAVRVSGSKLTLQAIPSTPSPGQTVTLNITVLDSGGNPIPGVAVNLGGTVPGIQNQIVTTTLAGTASKSLLAPTTAGIYTITASGSGVTAAEYQLQVFTSAIPAAVIPAGAVPSLSASPNVLAVNSPGSSTNKSTMRFLFLDSANRPVQNVRVRFVDVTTGIPAVGASISSGGGTLYTDGSGSVTAQYIAGQNSSPTNGVTVKACYSASDFASTTDCPAAVNASLTVAGQALAVSVGDDNLLAKGAGTYIKRFAVTVADSAGRAVANAPVDISVDLTHYGKGEFSMLLPVPPLGLLNAFPSDTEVPATQRVWCANEDTNRNGNVDPGENINLSVDSNGQPTLEPRKSDLIVSYADPAVRTTDESGVLVIKVEYSQRFATWLAYKVRVTANVAGSQGMAERLFVTSFVDSDLATGSFREPPYGRASCRSAD